MLPPLSKPVVINQPFYFPRLHWWQRALQGEFVVYDDVEHSMGNPSNRAVLRDADNFDRYLTIPLQKATRQLTFDAILIAEANFAVWHRDQMENYHRKAPYRGTALAVFDEFVERKSSGFLAALMDSQAVVAKHLGVEWAPIMASSLGVAHIGRSPRLIAICKKLGHDTLLLGSGSAGYVTEDAALYRDYGVTVTYQNWKPPIPNTSVLDAIAWFGLDRVREVLLDSRG